MLEQAFARGSDQVSDAVPVATERTEHSVMEGLPPAKAERIAAMRRELADLQRQLTEAQQRIATELHGRAEDAERLEAIEARLQAQEVKAQEDAARTAELVTEIASLRAKLDDAHQQHRKATEPLERQLEDQRDQHREATSQLESQLASMREANALAASRDGELAAITSERDAIKSELAATRARVRDLAGQLVDLTGDVADAHPPADSKPNPAAIARSSERPKPPPVPARVTASRPVETILEVTEEPKSKLRSGLVLLGGAILGCAATLAFVTWRGSGGDEREELGGSRPSVQIEHAPEHTPPVVPDEPVAPPSSPSVLAAPVADHASDQPAPPPPPPPHAEITTDGVIVLPPETADHRVYVDGHVVSIKNSRAVVPCGSHEIRIGSHGTPRTVDVACGGETSVPADMHDR